MKTNSCDLSTTQYGQIDRKPEGEDAPEVILKAKNYQKQITQ